MSAQELRSIRETAKLTQAEMGKRMGLGLSAYQELEIGNAPWRARHETLLERVSLRLAVERGDINLALPAVRRDALDLARLIRAD